MLTINYVTYFLCGILGIMFMIGIKLRALKIRTEAANEVFSIRNYFKDDYITIGLSIVSVIIGMIIINPLIKSYPEISGWTNVVFIGIGYTGTSVLLAFFSKAEVRINAIIDQKTGTTP